VDIIHLVAFMGFDIS